MNLVLSRIRRSRKQEAGIAKQLRGKPTVASGGTRNKFAKEDVVTRHFLCQAKFTDKKSYSMKAAEYVKTRRNAARIVKNPLWCVSINGLELAVLSWDTFLQLIMDAGYDDPL